MAGVRWRAGRARRARRQMPPPQGEVAGMWAIFTLIAAAAQTARNAMQRDLIGKIGSVGATQVRFLFGLPFSLLFLVGVEAAVQLPLPAWNGRSLAFVAIGAFAQIAATALMLAAMRRQSFVVV